MTGTPASASVPLAALGVVKEEGALKLNPCGGPSSRPYGLLVVAEELHRHDDQPTSSATQLDGPRRSLASLSRDPTSIAAEGGGAALRVVRRGICDAFWLPAAQIGHRLTSG